MSFDAPQMPSPILPTPVGQGQIKGKKPRAEGSMPTVLGSETIANPQQQSGFAVGKTFLGQ